MPYCRARELYFSMQRSVRPSFAVFLTHLDPDCDHVGDWIGGIRHDHRYLTSALKVAELAAALLLCQAGYET
jgi:hypothetical protein